MSLFSLIKALVPPELLLDLFKDGAETVVLWVVLVWFLISQFPNIFAICLFSLLIISQALKVWVWITKFRTLMKIGKAFS